MENDIQVVEQKHNAILLSLMYRAYSYDKELLQQELVAKELEIKKDNSLFSNFKNSLYRNSKIDNLNRKIDSCKRNIAELICNKDKSEYLLYYQTHLGNYINEFCSNDKYDISKVLLSIEFILSTNNKIVNDFLVMRDISNIIFENPTKLENIKAKLESNYKSITSTKLSSSQKKLLVGIGLASVTALAVVPVLAVGGITASAAITTSALATIGFMDMQIGVGMLALYGFLVGAAIVGGTYIGLKIYNNEQNKKEYKELCKKEFREIDSSEAKLFIAIKLTIIEHAKTVMTKAELKEYLSETLEILSALREDNLYLVFVEGKKGFSETDKMNLFHKMDDRLLKLI